MSLVPSLRNLPERANRAARLLLLGDTFATTKLEPCDVVVVTGGCSGLGQQLVRKLRVFGCKVIVLDICVPLKPLTGVDYYQCDISNVSEVEQIAARIKYDHGAATVLINNAGITNGKTLLKLSYEEIQRILKVNLYANFVTTKTLLPDMLANKRGYIVSVGSVLGYLSPAKLSAYGASKSGLVALHESLTYELGYPSEGSSGVKTLLVCPGQLETTLFQGVATPSRIIAPILKPERVADRIVAAMSSGQLGTLRMPFYTNLVPVIRALPWQWRELARRIARMDSAMRDDS